MVKHEIVAPLQNFGACSYGGPLFRAFFVAYCISEKEKNDSKFAYNYEKAESDIRFGLSWLLE